MKARACGIIAEAFGAPRLSSWTAMMTVGKPFTAPVGWRQRWSTEVVPWFHQMRDCGRGPGLDEDDHVFVWGACAAGQHMLELLRLATLMEGGQRLLSDA